METSMMTDPNLYLTMAAAGLAGLGMVCMAGLAGWRGWLTLKEREIGAYTSGHVTSDDPVLPNASARIEIADLKERIRKLEEVPPPRSLILSQDPGPTEDAGIAGEVRGPETGSG
jgi:hypothetical protein